MRALVSFIRIRSFRKADLIEKLSKGDVVISFILLAPLRFRCCTSAANSLSIKTTFFSYYFMSFASLSRTEVSDDLLVWMPMQLCQRLFHDLEFLFQPVAFTLVGPSPDPQSLAWVLNVSSITFELLLLRCWRYKLHKADIETRRGSTRPSRSLSCDGSDCFLCSLLFMQNGNCRGHGVCLKTF